MIYRDDLHTTSRVANVIPMSEYSYLFSKIVSGIYIYIFFFHYLQQLHLSFFLKKNPLKNAIDKYSENMLIF